MMYPLHCTCVKLMDSNDIFGIKYAQTKHIPGADVPNDPDMEF